MRTGIVIKEGEALFNKKGAAPIEATPEWSQGLLTFPGSTCSFNSIPYLSYKIVGDIVIIVARDSHRLAMRMIVYTMGNPSLSLLQNESGIS